MRFDAADAHRAKQIMRGLLSCVPWIEMRLRRGTGGTNSARYCYSVWLRHLCRMQQKGLTEIPHSMAEMGPGDSLGVGLAAMLTGVQHYRVLDVDLFAKPAENLRMLEELVALFQRREAIPNESEFPKVEPKLTSYEFPAAILTSDLLSKTLHSERVAAIRNTLMNPSGDAESDDIPSIRYVVPWTDRTLPEASVDLILSQAVLEHVSNLTEIYQAFACWLKPKGIMSHVIDFSSHNVALKWNGHLTYPDLTWKLLTGRRSCLPNRFPCSDHLALLKTNGFSVLEEERIRADNTIPRAEFNPRFRDLPEDDFKTRALYILAQKS